MHLHLCHGSRFANAAAALALIFCLARPAGAIMLPDNPKFPDFARLAPYDEPSERSSATGVKEVIKDFQQFVQADLPGFIEKHQANARRTGMHQYLLQSPDGRELLYIQENKGIAREFSYYRINDPAGRKLDPRLSRKVSMIDQNCVFSNQAGQHLGITMEATPYVSVYSALGLGSRVQKYYWNANGRLTGENKADLGSLQSREARVASTDFVRLLDARPYQGNYEKPADPATAEALEATMRAMAEDLREMAGLAQGGRLKWERNPQGQYLGKFAAPDNMKIIAVALRPDQRTLQQGESTLYDRIPEIRESVLRSAGFTCHSGDAGLYDYSLRTPQLEARCEFRPDHKLLSFSVYWISRGEHKMVSWDEKGKIQNK